MAHEIIWTRRARETYANIVDYLEKEWTEREIRQFVAIVAEKLEVIDASLKCLLRPTTVEVSVVQLLVSKQFCSTDI